MRDDGIQPEDLRWRDYVDDWRDALCARGDRRFDAQMNIVAIHVFALGPIAIGVLFGFGVVR